MTTLLRREKFTITIVFLFIFSTFSFSQKEEYDLAALQKKYPDQTAVILRHQQKVNIEVNEKTGELDIYETDIEVVLYLKESAKYYGQQSVSLSYFFEDLTEIEAVSYNPDGKKNKLKEEDFRIVDSQPSSWVFHDDNKEMIFEFPKLGAGYRTQIAYTKKIKKPEFFDVFHFVSGYPVLYSEVEINYPKDVQLKFHPREMEGLTIISKEGAENKGMLTHSWILNNLDAYEEEEGATNVKNHIPHIVAQIESYKLKGEEVKLISNVDDLHNYFEEFLLLKGDETDRRELNSIVAEITEGMDDELQMMDTIFRWVQSNIKYIAFEDGINGYVPRTCSSVMKNRYGDCKDMGNLLVEMLGYAGVRNAYVAWVGTRDIPYLMSEIPSPLTCNHVICVVDKPEGYKGEHKYYYLDATSGESSYILPPMAVQGKELLVHKGHKEYDLFKVPPAKAEENYIKSKIRLNFTTRDSLFGSGVDYYGGYERENRSYYLNNLKDNDLDDYVKELALGGANRYTLGDYSLEGLQDKNGDLEVHYNFSVDNLSIKDGNDLIINPTLFKPRVTKYSKDDYKYPREKSKHRTIEYAYEITIPENYRVKHVPEDVNYRHELFTFAAEFKVEGNVIYVNMGYQYHLMEIPADLFADWNEFSRSINSATIQNIILKENTSPE